MDNLPQIIRDDGLLSDAKMSARGGPRRSIGISKIKRRRREEIEVSCHPGTRVGEYVPFYFCPRSVMLFLICRGNHPDLNYLDGQELIIHLEADLYRVVKWADEHGVRWAFSLSNAGARYAEFRSDLQDLHHLDWKAIAARDFRDPDVKERKQAEFLVHGFFPFKLVERIGVYGQDAANRVREALRSSAHKPPVEVLRDWYY